MLRELTHVQQKPGEPRRRWFFSHDLDLVVWVGDDDQPLGFQLAYDKYRREHSITWDLAQGYRHYVVDEGNPIAGKAQTPLLWADGPFDGGRLIDRFRALAGDVPIDLTEFVIARLAEHATREPAHV